VGWRQELLKMWLGVVALNGKWKKKTYEM